MCLDTTINVKGQQNRIELVTRPELSHDEHAEEAVNNCQDNYQGIKPIPHVLPGSLKKKKVLKGAFHQINFFQRSVYTNE